MNDYMIISGDFTHTGGMDRANYELARHLAERRGATVHLVAHRVDAPLADHQNVVWHRVPKPLDRHTLGEPLLSLAGRTLAAQLGTRGAHVIANGGNCVSPDVNWVHAVHAAWERRDRQAPVWFRYKSALSKRSARDKERRALDAAQLVITNSNRARHQIIERLGVSPERVQTIYYGIDAQSYQPAGTRQRELARVRLGLPGENPVVAFIGALGHDRNKGFDVLYAAWRGLCRERTWDADLVVAGGGAEVALWRRRAAADGLEKRVRLLGYTDAIPDLLAASDALVSPTHYEAYGLGVHEALCCGLPAIVTRHAGVAERFPASLSDLLIDDPSNEGELRDRLLNWRDQMFSFHARVAPLGASLREHGWTDMAREIAQAIADTRIAAAC